MATLSDRIIKLESSRAGRTRYSVSWNDGSTTQERDIVKLLGLAMQPDHGGIREVTPHHQPPYNVLEKLASWFLQQPCNQKD